jgi:hypothetical protein
MLIEKLKDRHVFFRNQFLFRFSILFIKDGIRQSLYQRWNSLITLLKMEFTNILRKMKFTNLFIKDGIHQCLLFISKQNSPISLSKMEFTNLFLKVGIRQSLYQIWNSPMSLSKAEFTNVFIKGGIHQCLNQR